MRCDALHTKSSRRPSQGFRNREDAAVDDGAIKSPSHLRYGHRRINSETFLENR
jgi:hypothetical protein